MKNQFSLLVATINGSGSMSANTILTKALFRMGLQVGAKNLFPSNIAGLPTWFMIRVHPQGFVSRENLADIVVAKNSETAIEDLKRVKPGGFYFYDSEFKIQPQELRQDVTIVPIPFREIVETASDSIKMKKLLTNMVYLGILVELFKIDLEYLKSAIRSQFSEKEHVIEINTKAIELGEAYAREKLAHLKFPYTVETCKETNKNSIMIDGNAAAAIGALVGGCTFFSWYPITPSSSLAETFHSLAEKYRETSDGKKNYAMVQAEDELSAINMVVGAGWAGSRSMTATSGPGISLMAEAAGLSYFAEIPSVIWDVQRAGPSTGLPTRTLQGDLRAVTHLSHGDTEHPVLIPANPAECYEFAQTAFDLSEKFQTLVFVLSDLDLGMNLWMTPDLKLPTADFQRGKVLSAEDLNTIEEFARYRDVDNDGVPYRTLPGTLHMKAAYFTRGTGHNDKAGYTEDPQIFQKLLERLKKKFITLTKELPAPILDGSGANIGLLAYGTTDAVIPELRASLKEKSIPTDYLRVRAWPLAESVGTFLNSHNKIFVLEQNRDGQMRELLVQKYPEHAHKMVPILSYDGWPITAQNCLAQVVKHV
jgi:2-oxoglutarate ferredoxin oxidoreductase subunit alpha